LLWVEEVLLLVGQLLLRLVELLLVELAWLAKVCLGVMCAYVVALVSAAGDVASTWQALAEMLWDELLLVELVWIVAVCFGVMYV
jgi:hypothetical protein